MRTISDAGPLVALAKIDQFHLLEKLLGRLVITPEVYGEVVVAGAGLPGSDETSKAAWIEVQPIKNHTSLLLAQARFNLDLGELSTLVLGKETGADLLLLDDLSARKLAQMEGFRVQGTVGILEACYARKYLSDLRQAYAALLAKGVYLDRAFLDLRLRLLQLPPL